MSLDFRLGLLAGTLAYFASGCVSTSVPAGDSRDDADGGIGGKSVAPERNGANPDAGSQAGSGGHTTASPDSRDAAPTTQAPDATPTTQAPDAAADRAGDSSASIVVPGLNARAYDLGGGRVRLEYDFEDPAQRADWQPVGFPATPASGEISRGELVLTNPIDEVIGLRLARPMRVDRLQFDATLASGTHINAYIQTVWDNVWNPAQGYLMLHRYDGRNWTIDGTNLGATGQGTVVDTPYHVVIDASESALTWEVNGYALELTAQSRGKPFNRDTQREVILGTWNSNVRFDNVVIEGELN